MKKTLKILVFLLVLYPYVSLYAQFTIIVFPQDMETKSPEIPASWRQTSYINEALQYAKTSSQPDITLFFYEGVHYLPETLLINSKDFKGKSLRLTSFSENKAIISGGRKLQVKWQPVQGKRYYKAFIDNKDINIDQLFINGEKRILARYPNYEEGERLNMISQDALARNRTRLWKNPKGGYIHALHNREWGSVHYEITGISNGNPTYIGGFQNNRPSDIHPQYRYVENIFEELDSPGEWFFDKKNKTLYYYPLENEKITDINSIEIAKLPSLIHIVGTEDNPIRNITVENLTFTHTERTFMKEYEPLMRSDWSIHRGAAVFMEFAEGCSINNCDFLQLGGNAIFISKYALNCHVKGNHIRHTGASAICVVGDTSCVRSPSFNYNEFVSFDKLDKTPGPKNSLYPRQCIIDNNLIHDIGETEKQVAGVQIQLASQINVRHNTIYNVPRAAINVGDGAFGGHIIEYNDAFNTVLETSDHGAFNSWGRDRFWHPSYETLDTLTANNPELILLDAVYTAVIRNNRFQCSHGWDIDLDDGSSNYHIYNNLCLEGGKKLREGFYRKVENNILINNTFHPHVWFKNSDDVFQRNIVMKPYEDIRLQGWGKFIDYNFFSDSQALQSAQKNGIDVHSVSGKLQFIDPTNGDFQVIPNSPASSIGFENFPMDKFGVYSPHLKLSAQKAPIPSLNEDSSQKSSVNNNMLQILGLTIRNVEGLGDRSAFGLPDEKGVVVVSLEDNSPFSQSEIQEKDVLRSVNGHHINNVNDVLTINENIKKNKTFELLLFRNQQEKRVQVIFK